MQIQLRNEQRELIEIEQMHKAREIEYEERLIDMHKRELAVLAAEGKLKLANVKVEDIDEISGSRDNNNPDLQREIRELRDKLAELRARTEDAPTGTPPVTDSNTGLSTHLSFKDILESVPTFSGDNIPILKFTRACERAKDMIPPPLEPTFTRLLRNRLKGRAYTAIEDDTFRTVAALTDHLKDIFGTAKSVNQFRDELGNVVKGKTEHVLDYISRVKDLH